MKQMTYLRNCRVKHPGNQSKGEKDPEEVADLQSTLNRVHEWTTLFVQEH